MAPAHWLCGVRNRSLAPPTFATAQQKEEKMPALRKPRKRAGRPIRQARLRTDRANKFLSNRQSERLVVVRTRFEVEVLLGSQCVGFTYYTLLSAYSAVCVFVRCVCAVRALLLLSRLGRCALGFEVKSFPVRRAEIQCGTVRSWSIRVA